MLLAIQALKSDCQRWVSQKEERGVDDQSAGGYESDPAETDDSEPDTEEEHGDVLYMDENAWETTQRYDLETTQCDELDVTQRDDYDEASEDEHSWYVVKVTGSPHCGMLAATMHTESRTRTLSNYH